MKVPFVGGPLDGAVDEQGEMIRIFPDPTDPENRVVVYALTAFPKMRYAYDPLMSERANLKLKRERDQKRS